MEVLRLLWSLLRPPTGQGPSHLSDGLQLVNTESSPGRHRCVMLLWLICALGARFVASEAGGAHLEAVTEGFMIFS